MEYLQFRRLLRREISTIFRLPQNGWRSENINDCNELREEKRINDNFNTDGTVKELKAILRVYWIEHMKAISYFKESGQKGIPLDEIRTKSINELTSYNNKNLRGKYIQL